MKTGIKKKDIITFTLASFFGYGLFWFTSHPYSSVHKRIPKKRIRCISLLPHIKIGFHTHTLHVHHWFTLFVLYTLVAKRRKQMFLSPFVSGFTLGSIIQGLSYSDRFRLLYKNMVLIDELAKK